MKFMPNSVFAGAYLIGAIMAISPASALTQKQIDWCVNKEKTYSADLRIDGCAAAIQSGRWKGSNLAWAYANRGNAHFTKGQYDLTIRDFNTAINLDSSRADRYYGRGRAYRAKGEYDKAIADYSTAIAGFEPAKYPAYYKRDYFYARGYAFANKRQYDLAIADFDEAIRIDPTYAESYYERGLAWEAKQNLQKALADFKTYVDLDPSNSDGPKAVARVTKALSNR